MAPPSQSAVRNRLLKALSPSDYALLQSHLLLIPVEPWQLLVEPDAPVKQLYFVEEGLVSLTTTPAMRLVEVGLVGWEGLVGALPVVLGVDRTPFQAMVQMRGEALRITTADLRQAMERSPTLTALLLRFVTSQMIQTAQTAYANATFDIESRLARWLLMCHDRTAGDVLLLTHEFLSIMLGVHRPGVTVAVQVLEGNQLIRATRGRITILNRSGLEAVADTSYGLAEAEYASLIGAG